MTLEKYNFIANTVNKVKRDVRIAFITRTVVLRDDTRIVPYVARLGETGPHETNGHNM